MTREEKSKAIDDWCIDTNCDKCPLDAIVDGFTECCSMALESENLPCDIDRNYKILVDAGLIASENNEVKSRDEQAFKEASHKISTAIVGGKEQMTETKYYITVDNKTVAENVTIEYVRIFISAIFEVYFNEHDMVVAIAEMPRCKENENDDHKRQIS